MTYTVKPGDTLSRIATRNGVTLAQLLQANPQVKDPNRIKVGDVINLPADSTGVPAGSTDDTKPLPAISASAAAAPPPTYNPQPEAASTYEAAGALGKALADELGILSAKYETGGRGPGVVSSGVGDPGGVSYGSYQMATKTGTARRFVTQNDFPWLKDFSNLTPGTADFSACWKRIAASDTDAFQKCQHQYIKRTHYDPLVAKILNDTYVDINSRSNAVQNVVWSTAVQHGPATPIVNRALGTLSCKPADPQYDELLIRAIYAERGRRKPDGNLAYFGKSSPSVQTGVANRFKSELQDALKMLAKEV
jgi:murein DD-endopeptidase MepM/ murein hydrolase activator NlpD